MGIEYSIALYMEPTQDLELKQKIFQNLQSIYQAWVGILNLEL